MQRQRAGAGPGSQALVRRAGLSLPTVWPGQTLQPGEISCFSEVSSIRRSISVEVSQKPLESQEMPSSHLRGPEKGQNRHNAYR